MSGERLVILHGHIFKNAGTTLDWALQRNFGDGFVDHRDDRSMRRRGAAYLGPYLEERPWIRALSSHHLCHPLPAVPGALLVPIYLFRHPIERVLSVYEYERRQQADTPGAINAKRMDLPEYVVWRMEPESGATIRDFQTRYLAGQLEGRLDDVTADVVATARANLERPSLIGVVERFADSVLAFEEALRRDLPGINLAYVRQNVTRGRAGQTLDDRLVEIDASLPDDILDLLLVKNQNDLHLYAEANRVLDERLAAVADLAERRSDFARRMDLVADEEARAAAQARRPPPA